MSQLDHQTQPLIGASNPQTAIDVGQISNSGSSSRAFKVAGFTLLACLLIAGQALTAYFVLSQRSDIKSLTDKNNDLRDEMTRSRVAAVPMKTHMASPSLIAIDAEASSDASEKTASEQTNCQLQAAQGMPNFHPACDEQGRYKSQQCWMDQCWCVDKLSGKMIPDTMGKGPARCPDTTNAMSAGALHPMMALADVMTSGDE